MATTLALAYPHIVKDPAVLAGRATIAGTRVRVMDVVTAHRAGVSAEQLREYFESRPLTRSEVYAALGYYYDHQDEVDQDLAEDERLGQQAERERLSKSR